MGTSSTRRKVMLFGVFGAGNLGNECTLQALLWNLGRYLPNAEITCICSEPDETASTYSISAVPIREVVFKIWPQVSNRWVGLLRKVLIAIPTEVCRWYRAARTLRGNGMLVMTGTGMLGDFGISALGLHYDILRWSIVAKLCRIKLVFLSVGVGPIRQPLSRCFVRLALRLADYRSYRDSFSRDYLQRIGFETNGDAVYPDLAFSLPKAVIPGTHKHNGQGTVIGVGVMTYQNRRSTLDSDDTIYRAYVAKVAVFVSWLLRHNYTVRLLIGDARYDNRVRHDLRGLLEGIGFRYEDGNIIDEPATSFSEVLSQLAATDVVVASRFHNVLLALMVTKLVVAVSYHEKVDSLMTGFGLLEFCQDIERVDIDKLIGQVTALETSAKRLRPQIERRTEVYRMALDEQYDRVFKGD
jgi:polysaccharide pyruvyl transferase WcaK-like protein